MHNRFEGLFERAAEGGEASEATIRSVGRGIAAGQLTTMTGRAAPSECSGIRCRSRSADALRGQPEDLPTKAQPMTQGFGLLAEAEPEAN